MRRRVLVVYAALLLSALAGALIGSQSPYVHAGVTANGITPAPGRHSEVRASFAFLVKDAPGQLGWRSAEYKDEYGAQFYKADVAPGCGEWQTVGGDTRPGLLLTPGGVTCPGFRIDFGALYWFSAPPIVVTASPTPLTSTATVTPPPPMGATATSSPTVASGATVTPSPQGEATPSAQPPTGTPTHPIMTVTATPMFPQFPTCTTQILIYWAGDPAAGGLGGKVGDVGWCGSCNSGCGVWTFGVDKATLDGWTDDANRRVRELWMTATVEAR